MKSLVKIFSVLLAVSALAFGVVSCSDEEEEELKEVATFYGVGSMTEDGVAASVQLTVKFYNSSEYKIHTNVSAVNTGNGAIAAQDYDSEIGTYTGDPTKNNTTVKLTTKKEYDTDKKAWISLENATPESLVIDADGKITITDDDLSMTLTRQ